MRGGILWLCYGFEEGGGREDGLDVRRNMSSVNPEWREHGAVYSNRCSCHVGSVHTEYGTKV